MCIRDRFKENGLEFVELFQCNTFVYLWAGHPLAKQDVISMEELDEYPCLSFDQGKNSSLYLAEEMKSTYEYRRLIKANDRATLLNLMRGLNAYTLCSGIICEDLNGDEYVAIPLKETEKMKIGYLKRKGAKMCIRDRVMTDRSDLDDQLYAQFSQCADFLRQTPIQAESKEHLLSLIHIYPVDWCICHLIILIVNSCCIRHRCTPHFS